MKKLFFDIFKRTKFLKFYKWKSLYWIDAQLIYGIRYLDIRAGFNDHSAEKFWTMHDFVAMNPMYKVRPLMTSQVEIH